MTTKIMEMNPFDHKRQLAESFARRLVDTYGYSMDQMGLDVKLSAGLTADIAIWRSASDKQAGLSPNIYILVTCKAEHIKIKEEDYASSFKQAVLYDMAFYIAHNLKETKVFFIDKHARPLKIERISDFPTASDIVSDSSVAHFIAKSRAYSKDQFLKVLSRCHHIIRNIDKLSPEAAFDEISKVLFVKMLYERDSKEELVYSKEKFLKDEAAYRGSGDYIQFLFHQVKMRYLEDGLFDADDRIRIRRESLLMILEELGNVELYDTSDDLKGIAFELFLGKTFRGELGQFFTPRTVVNYMVDVLNVKEGDKVCDPCCGSGGFLIKAFEHVQNAIDEAVRCEVEDVMQSSLSDEEKNARINALFAEFDKTKAGSRYYKLCHDYFFGVDANVRMARTSKMNMIMHGDGHVGVYHHDGLINVGGVYDNRFDVILINPPFGAHVEKEMRITSSDIPTEDEKTLYMRLYGEEYLDKVYAPLLAWTSEKSKDGKRGKRILDIYEIPSNNTEILFIERCIRLLKPGKRAGIVLPEGVLDNPAMERVRRFVESKARILNITSIPSDVFLSSGANIKPSLIFIEKYAEGQSPLEDYELTVTQVSDAGISSIGLPSENKELPEAAREILSWLDRRPLPDMKYTRVVHRSELLSWSVKPIFDVPAVHFNPAYTQVKLREILSVSRNFITVRPETEYTRVTVRLFNKGLCVRDRVWGRSIGTKRQLQVKTGQFVVSKIDGKSAAFGIVDAALDGAIVTPDFMVFDIVREKVLPEYLELVLGNKSILQQFESSSSGTTGRKRLSQQVFENTCIALPPMEVQRQLVERIQQTRTDLKKMEERMLMLIDQFNNQLFIRQ